MSFSKFIAIQAYSSLHRNFPQENHFNSPYSKRTSIQISIGERAITNWKIVKDFPFLWIQEFLEL